MVGSTSKVYGPKTQFAHNLDEMHQAATGKIKGRTVVARGSAVSVGRKQNAFIEFLTAIASRIPHLKHKVPTSNAKIVAKGYVKYLEANKAKVKGDDFKKALDIFKKIKSGIKTMDVKLEEDFRNALKPIAKPAKSTKGGKVSSTKAHKASSARKPRTASAVTPAKRRATSGRTKSTKVGSKIPKGLEIPSFKRKLPKAPSKTPSKTRSTSTPKKTGAAPAGKTKSVPAKRKSV